MPSEVPADPHFLPLLGLLFLQGLLPWESWASLQPMEVATVALTGSGVSRGKGLVEIVIVVVVLFLCVFNLLPAT